MRGRALRRHHDSVQKRRARHFFGGRQTNPHANGINATTPKPCSSWCCGNPRRHSQKATFQEKQQELALGEGLAEYELWLEFDYWDELEEWVICQLEKAS